LNTFRRYSVNIPNYYGDRNPDLKGKTVPGEELDKTIRDLQEKVKGMTGVPELKLFPRVPKDVVPFEGIWKNILDTGIIIYFDVPISEKENMDNYMSEYKKILAERFGQIEMYIVSWEIEVI
jgi:hypothetical protein